MTESIQYEKFFPFVLERLTEENLRASRTEHGTAFDGLFYAAFGIDHASIGDTAGLHRLQRLAEELSQAPAVASRLLELQSRGLSVEFVVYDEPAGHFLCILVKDHAIYDQAFKDQAFKELEVMAAQKQRETQHGRRQSLLSWIRGKFVA